jgi:release factor glutamine methyltransferase
MLSRVLDAAAMTLTLVKAWTAARRALEAAGVDTPVIDARILLLAATGHPRAVLISEPHTPMSPEAVATFDSYVARRAAREPAAHIVGTRGFWTLDLKSDGRGLVPRPETEVIVDLVLKGENAEVPLRILDLGTGPGTILLALLAERPQWTGVGVDVSEDALSLARDNAELHGLKDRVQWLSGVWGQGITEAFDVIVSNPPYIASAVIDTLQPEVRDYDPRLALDGGVDGLEAYRAIIPDLPRLLKPNGLFVLEIGHDQSKSVPAMVMTQPLLGPTQVVKDLSDLHRVVIGHRLP